MVTYNSQDLLLKAIRSVERHVTGLSYELIVVDNGSSDGTVALAETAHPGVNILRNDRNTGYAPAMNRALASAGGEFVLTMSHDAELTAGAVSALVGFMRSHPNAGAAGPRTLDGHGGVVSTLHHPSLMLSVWTEIIPLRAWLRRRPWLRRLLGRIAPNSSGLTSDYSRTHRVAVLDGGCLIIRRSVTDRVGTLDERLMQGPDDYDFCCRLNRAGFETWFVAEAEVVHRSRPKEKASDLSLTSLRTRLPQMTYLYRKFNGRFSSRLFNLSAWLLLRKWRREVRRTYGSDSIQAAALSQAEPYCLNPGRYARDYQELWWGRTSEGHCP
jgi:GT2 family glycosyltransferase